jgi:hypothetical protein
LALVTDDHDLGTTVEEPSAEDFEAAAEEEPQVGARVVLVRILKSVGVLFVILALLLYFVIPFYSTFRRVQDDWRRPNTEIRQIPVAPEPTSTPRLRV